jgi:hypothetical protein
VPSGCTSRTVNFAEAPWLSIHDTSARPSVRSVRPTRPSVVPLSMRTGGPNVRPPSFENAICVFGALSLAANQATATAWPFAAIAGALSGQPLISQLSACTGVPADHLPFSKRLT